MASLFALLFLLTLVGLGVGIFKPSLVPLRGRRSRGRIFKFYGGAAFGFFLMVGLTAPSPEKTSPPQPVLSNVPAASVTPQAATPSVTPSPIASPSPVPSSSQFKFPQQTCGDSASGSNDTWYPVFAEAERLAEIQKNYCADAIKTVRQENGKPAVQVASFTNQERATAFSKILKGEVGKPTEPKTTSSPTPLPEKQIEPEVIVPASPPSPAIGSPIREASQGSCDCPYDVDRRGRTCGSRSAYSRPGGSSPACYVGDR
jgi:hypothetical protein